MDWVYTGIFFIALFFVILLAEGLRKLFNWIPDTTRKLVHIMTGIFISSVPFLFHSKIPILTITIFFTIINYFAIQFGFLKAMHGTARKSFGTVYYPLSLIILLLFFWEKYQLILVIAMLVLAFGDALAALFGENLKKLHYYQLAGDRKTIEGSLVMLITAFLIVLGGLFLGSNYVPGGFQLSFPESIWVALIVSIIATLCEAISSSGSDNLTVPLGTAFFLHFMLSRFNGGNQTENIQLSIGLFLAFIVALISFRLRFLSLNGSVATFLLGTVVFGIGGWAFSLPILAFFILSSLLSKLGGRKKKKLDQTFEKSSQRDMWQVAANGGLPFVLVLIWNFYRIDFIFYLYLAALSAVTADTWGTEIGFFSKKRPRFILSFKEVPAGTSGGITLLGTLGGAIGALIIALVGWLSHFSGFTFQVFLMIIMSGILASVVDSILGATIQAQFKCPNCQKITEKIVHCYNIPTVMISGIRWVRNDLVNFLAAVSGLFWLWILNLLI
ncbi:DUF92 domain-containing protein [candidate division KSB1 bacterium]|nr:DUF92 domain-containing protein [candidate division KSB1 bacterium]